MTRFLNSRISWKQACGLGLIVSIIYFPVILYINVKPADQNWLSGFFIFPAIVSFLYYTLFIFVADRLMEKAEVTIGDRFLRESQVPAIMVSIPFAIIATMLSGYLFSTSIRLMHTVGGYLGTPLIEPDPEVIQNLQRVNDGLTFIVLLSISYLIFNRKATIKLKTLELQSQQLANENTVAQFEALKNQLSPHFLFNSLSILSSLVHVNSDLSKKYIDKLSKSYRYILEQKDNDLIPLSVELDFINSYAFLVKMRFAEKFDLKVDISSSQAAQFSIAPLTLQLLVENAVKHNKMSAKDPLFVNLSIEEDYLKVYNELRPREANDLPVSTHVGLQNIKNRYNLITTKPVVVAQEHGQFIVKIPLVS